MSAIEYQHRLDAIGLLCPEPVMLLHNKVREMQEGEVLKVIATDPSTERDIPKFCIFLGHTLLQSEKVDDLYCYWIQKTSAK